MQLQGLEILKASLNKSKNVLIDVFLAKKKKEARTSGDKNARTSQQQQEKRAHNDERREKSWLLNR